MHVLCRLAEELIYDRCGRLLDGSEVAALRGFGHLASVEAGRVVPLAL
jgi:hypothetical protein